MYNITTKTWSDGSQSVSMAWNTYKEQMGAWILMYISINAITLACLIVPWIGNLLSSFAGVILNGIFIGLTHNYVHHKKDPSTDMVSQIIDKHLNDFIKLGAIGIGIQFAFGFFFAFVMVGIIFSTIGIQVLQVSDPQEIQRTIETLFVDETFTIILFSVIFFMLSLSLIFAVLYFMAFVFAPYLIIVENEDVFRALKMSFQACQENLWSLTSLSLWWMLLVFVGVISCCLGMLVAGPMIPLSTYFLASMIFVRANSISIDKT